MTEKKSIHSFFEKRSLRPAKVVNYALQDIPPSPKKPVRRANESYNEKENNEDVKEQMQASHDLTKLLLEGKAVNPFFDKKANNAIVKCDETVNLIEPLIPTYQDCHVGHYYKPSRGNIFSLFPKRSNNVINYESTDQTRLVVIQDCETAQSKISTVRMSQMELDNYLSSQFTTELLQEPCIRVLYDRLIGPYQESSAQWNDKYAPICSEQILGSTNRIYASSLLKYIEEWKPKNKIRPIPKKVAKYHKLDDFDEFIISDEDLEYDTSVSNKHQLIIGPPGVGKTALVSAVAKEANISILEIHSGIKRTGKDLISTLGETTSSRLVGGGKKATIDANWFQEKKEVPKKRRKKIIVNSSDEEIEVDQEHINHNATLKKPRKQVEQEQSLTKKKKDITNFFKPRPKGGIASFFKPIKKSDAEEPIQNAPPPESPPRPPVVLPEIIPSSVSPPPRFAGLQNNDQSILQDNAEEAKTASSRKTVIVLDSADVITEQDKGFWNGVSTLFETSRRPIILCCNENPLISSNSAIPSSTLETLLQSIEIYQICPPEEDELKCYLTLLLLNEGIMIEPLLFEKIFSRFKSDIRQIILFLQISTKIDTPMVLNDADGFNFYKIDELDCTSPICSDEIQIWSACGIPNDLDGALRTCDSISNNDFKIRSSYFSNRDTDFQNHKSWSDLCFLFPLLADNQPPSTETSFRDIQCQLEIVESITVLASNSEKERPQSKDAAVLPYYDFPKWPYMKSRLNDVSNLLFWDSSIQVPRCFITEMLPWLSILLRNAHLVKEDECFHRQTGRTRRSKRKALRLFEGELTDEQFESLAKKCY